MSVNLYQTGVSALLSAQQQLATTGHNIANVNTDGYTRQRAEQNARPGIDKTPNYVGEGTYIEDIRRIYDDFSYKEQLNTLSQSSGADTAKLNLEQLNNVMSLSSEAIHHSMNEYYLTLNSIADNPSDLTLRNIALSQANSLSNNFNTLNDNFDALEKSSNNQVGEIARKLSNISQEIASINETILQSQNGITGQPNDLLDTRDELINQVGEYTKVTTLVDSNGVMTVMIGQGNTLVAGITAMTVEAKAGDPDPLQTELYLVGSNSAVALKGESLGGSIAANLSFRNEHIKQAREEINLLALAISETFNASQADGLDLNGIQGGPIFSDINSLPFQQSRVMANSDNTGTLAARVNITDTSLVPSGEFEIKFDGIDYLMTDKSNQNIINLGVPGAGTYTTPFGFEFIEDAGTPALEDSFTIRPAENAAASMKVVLNNGAGFAASSAVEVRASDNNISGGTVKITDMADPVGARSIIPMRVDVLESPAGSGLFTYTYTDNSNVTSAPIAYTPPSQSIVLPPAPAPTAFTIEIAGTPSGIAPSAPEQFFIEDAFGEGNGSNALAIALTQEKEIINGGTVTFSQSLSNTTAAVGSNASTAELMADSAQSLFTQAFNRNQSISGVNLDEEAANMLKFQQAYQAASQIISVANTIFDTLLSVTR